jgi:transketolase
MNDAKSKLEKENQYVYYCILEMGNGVDFMMYSHAWHGKANDTQLEIALGQNYTEAELIPPSLRGKEQLSVK